MKKFLLCSLLLCVSVALSAQDTAYVFSVVKENKITPVKNQSRTGTCWCFSTLAFLEAELLRMGKGEADLSEMFVVNHVYKEKADKYIRMHGAVNYSEGALFHDAMRVFRNYGAVPEEVMPGLNYGEDKHAHGELSGGSKAYLDVVLKNPNRKLSTAWKSAHAGIVDAYLGELPAKFSYKGKEYTPKTYAASLGINPDDYMDVTSFTHHPFGQNIILEIPDNWSWGSAMNVPIDDLMAMIDRSIMNGYCVLWGSDVSDRGFTNEVAVVPDMQVAEVAGLDKARFVDMKEKEKEDAIYRQKGPCKEKVITQEIRQQEFDNYQTTDDHGMLIYGIVKDQTGKKFYMVKNSWGTESKYQGCFYASEAFVKLKTTDILIHKSQFK